MPAKVENGAATIAIPPSLHLGGYVGALASPTLGGHPGGAHHAATAAERRAALALAAQAVGGVAPAKLTVRNLTAIDLGRGTAVISTLNLRGSGAQHVDRRLFLIAEPRAGTLRAALADVQKVRVTEPLLRGNGRSPDRRDRPGRRQPLGGHQRDRLQRQHLRDLQPREERLEERLRRRRRGDVARRARLGASAARGVQSADCSIISAP